MPPPSEKMKPSQNKPKLLTGFESFSVVNELEQYTSFNLLRCFGRNAIFSFLTEEK
jgi:hypothetical protein